MVRAFAMALLLCACGSRTGIVNVEDEPAEDASVRDTFVRDVPSPVDTGGPACGCTSAVVLAADTPSPTAIAIDSTHVYWTSSEGCDEGSVLRIPKCGGVVEVLAAGEANPRAIALDDERVYYYDACGSGLLRSVPKGGGAIQTYPISVMDSGRALAVGPDRIYFSDYGLLQIPKDGGTQSTIEEGYYVYAVAADARGVYWMGPRRASSTYAVFSHHPGDATATMLAMPADVSNDLIIDDDSIFYFGGRNIWRMPRDGGDATSVVSGTTGWRMAVDERFVYWTVGFMGSGGYTVYRAPKTGGDAVEIGAGGGAYVDIAVDDRCVYVADLYGDEIRTFSK